MGRIAACCVIAADSVPPAAVAAPMRKARDGGLRRILSPNAFPIQIPIGFEKEIVGFVDLVQMKAYTYKDFTDKEYTVGEIPADLVEKAKKYRHKNADKRDGVIPSYRLA